MATPFLLLSPSSLIIHSLTQKTFTEHLYHARLDTGAYVRWRKAVGETRALFKVLQGQCWKFRCQRRHKRRELSLHLGGNSSEGSIRQKDKGRHAILAEELRKCSLEACRGLGPQPPLSHVGWLGDKSRGCSSLGPLPPPTP